MICPPGLRYLSLVMAFLRNKRGSLAHFQIFAFLSPFSLLVNQFAAISNGCFVQARANLHTQQNQVVDILLDCSILGCSQEIAELLQFLQEEHCMQARSISGRRLSRFLLPDKLVSHVKGFFFVENIKTCSSPFHSMKWYGPGKAHHLNLPYVCFGAQPWRLFVESYWLQAAKCYFYIFDFSREVGCIICCFGYISIATF